MTLIPPEKIAQPAVSISPGQKVQGQKVSHCGNLFSNWKNIQICDTYSTNKFIAQPAASISPGQKVQGQKESHCGNFSKLEKTKTRHSCSTNKFIPQPAASISPGQKGTKTKGKPLWQFFQIEKVSRYMTLIPLTN